MKHLALPTGLLALSAQSAAAHVGDHSTIPGAKLFEHLLGWNHAGIVIIAAVAVALAARGVTRQVAARVRIQKSKERT